MRYGTQGSPRGSCPHSYVWFFSGYGFAGAINLTTPYKATTNTTPPIPARTSAARFAYVSTCAPTPQRHRALRRAERRRRRGAPSGQRAVSVRVLNGGGSHLLAFGERQ